MEALEELLGGPKDHTQIIKGKRSKRQRPQSPIPFSIATHNSSSGDGYGGSNIIGGENTNSSDEFPGSAATEEEEEEEDMVANCLILLAQGPSSSKPVNYPDQENAGGFKFTSKRFLEAPSTGGGKVGMYVYQCKTCDRTFPSFQALGGHRASHKRPKPPPMVEVKRKMKFFSDDEEEEEGGGGGGGGQIKNHLSSSLSLQLSNRPNLLPKSSPKVHECSICGAEFASGQALGGHMRRHRVSIGTNTTLSLSPLSPIGFESEDQEAKKQRTLSSLDLDLNLPAPIEDQVGESKYSFASEQQQQQQSSLVLSTGPTLVDCHY